MYLTECDVIPFALLACEVDTKDIVISELYSFDLGRH